MVCRELRGIAGVPVQTRPSDARGRHLSGSQVSFAGFSADGPAPSYGSSAPPDLHRAAVSDGIKFADAGKEGGLIVMMTARMPHSDDSQNVHWQTAALNAPARRFRFIAAMLPFSCPEGLV